jgi:hypothetical protein
MTPTTDKLWCIHIPGPDDLYAAPSHEMAEHMAACHNATMREFFDRNPEKLTQWGVTLDEIKAQVIEWPYDSDDHAEDLMHFDSREWGLDEPHAIRAQKDHHP